MHTAITKKFKKYHLFGFTGTPIFAINASNKGKFYLQTTEQTFGDQLHTYTIVDAINDKNVLPFRVDYIKTMNISPDINDKDVWDIDREDVFLDPRRIELVTKYILEHFNQKTYRNQKTFNYYVIQNVNEIVASQNKKNAAEFKEKQRINGFNSIFAVSSITAAKLYYNEFKKQMMNNKNQSLKIGLIYSYGANEEELDGILDEENSEDTISLDQSSRDFLDSAIDDYNKMFSTNYDTTSEKFQNYYKDISLRMKNKELDLLIVVNMFLTGFDATTLNTLWVDKNLKMHGLIQAFSRTNRVLNSIKTFGNIVCFRNLQKRTDEAISLFGDKNAAGIVLLKGFKDYYYGYTDSNGNNKKGYIDLINELKENFSLNDQNVLGEKKQKEFIILFGTILRMRNLLSSFDEFVGLEILSDREFQDYCGRYLDIKDQLVPYGMETEKINEDIVFEIELLKQVEINIDYVLMLVQKYHDSHCNDRELFISIQKAIDSSPELRSKKTLIEKFIANINEVDDVLTKWRNFIVDEKENELMKIIKNENLKEKETRKFIENSFKNGMIKTTGTDITEILPPTSRFSGENRDVKKQNVILKLIEFFEKFFGLF